MKFHDYIYGVPNVEVESDHKPLEAILKRSTSKLQKWLWRCRNTQLLWFTNLVNTIPSTSIAFSVLGKTHTFNCCLTDVIKLSETFSKHETMLFSIVEVIDWPHFVLLSLGRNTNAMTYKQKLLRLLGKDSCHMYNKTMTNMTHIESDHLLHPYTYHIWGCVHHLVVHQLLLLQ